MLTRKFKMTILLFLIVNIKKPRYIFRFPLSSPDLLSKWLTVMRKDKWVPTKDDLLCSFHFADDQFIENNGFRFLIPTAVPSKFEVLAPPKVCIANAYYKTSTYSC